MFDNSVGLIAKNSINYVELLFEAYAAGKPVFLLKSRSDEIINKANVGQVLEPTVSHGWFSTKWEFRKDSELAHIAFTSGTEGLPKGVLLSHGQLSDVTDRLNHVMEVDSSISEYVGVPAHFSFGLGRFRAVSAAGGKSFLPKDGFNPIEFRDMLTDGSVNSLSVVPTMVRSLLRLGDKFSGEVRLLKWIEIGSQHMSRLEKEKLRSLFPNAIIVQHYGLTEASRSTFLRIDRVHGEYLESVGMASGSVEVAIGDGGRIKIRGPHVAKLLLKDGKLESNVDQNLWVTTGDLGRINSGYLYFDGRADDQINIGGTKISPDAFEAFVGERLGIGNCIAVTGLPDPVMGYKPIIAILSEFADKEEEIRQIGADFLAASGIRNPAILATVCLSRFPVTPTGKVQRKLLSEQLINIHVPASTVSGEPETDLHHCLIDIWKKVLMRQAVGVDDNFFEIGGDSLAAVVLIGEINTITGLSLELIDIFERPTIRRLTDASHLALAKDYTSVVTLQDQGKNTPIFLLFGIQLYQRLATALGQAQPVYGVYVSREIELIDGAMSGNDVAMELAALYCEAILRIQPDGPYQVGGISFGGVVAYEVAKLLQSRGQHVSVLVLLDSVLPVGVRRTPFRRFIKSVDDIKIRLRYISHLVKNDKEAVTAIRRKWSFHRLMNKGASTRQVFTGKTLLIKAADKKAWGRGVTFKNDYGWSSFLSQDPLVFEVDADHLGIIDEFHAADTAGFIKQYLSVASAPVGRLKEGLN